MARSKAAKPVSFNSVLEKFDSNLWYFHITVPEEIALPFVENKDRRVICRINDKEEFQCALMHKGDGGFFINVNKQVREKLGLRQGTELRASIRKDESEYGLPMPEELAELMKMDDEGSRYFHALTPGKQRTLLYIIGSPKGSDIRVRRAIGVINHLKKNNGNIHYKGLNEEIRNTP